MNKFFNFLYGYVIIEVYGKQTARFINICLRRGIGIIGTRPMKGGAVISIKAADFNDLRPIARKCHVRVKIKEKRGIRYMPFLYGKRYALPFIAAAFIALYIISTQYIWLIEINGAKSCDMDALIQTLENVGVRRGGRKKELAEGMEIKRQIIESSDKIAWAWVYIDGAKARVEIYERKTAPKVIDKSVPCDIVAVRDGVIKDMNVKSGEDRFKEGDAVSEGDVLVSGKVAVYKEGYGEEYIYVHSIAEVAAYTSHTRREEGKLYRHLTQKTGRRTIRPVIELFGKAVTLPAGKIKYEKYERSEKRHELRLPLFGYSGAAFDIIEYAEVTEEKIPISPELAAEIAKNKLEEEISNELSKGSRLIDEKLEYEITDDETINVTLKMNFIENIAAEKIP